MAKLPEKKHDDTEINQIRARNAFSVRPPVLQIKNLALNPILLILCYLLCVTGAVLSFYKMSIPALSCAGVTVLCSVFIFWKKPRSGHHAALMTIISLLVLVFSSVYHKAQLEQTNNDPQGPTRY